jgi:type VI secretion system protein ImpA
VDQGGNLAASTPAGGSPAAGPRAGAGVSAAAAVCPSLRELGQEPSGRGRFLRKSQLAQLCVATGHQPIAFPILQDMASEIERRKLEDWETAEMVAHPLALLYKCLNSDAAPEDRQKLYSWICRLDPLQALNITK